MIRGLPALLALLLLLVAAHARAADTYCVGGYSGTPPDVVAACERPEVARLHAAWHQHCWLTDGKACFICYDEEDNTCITVFLLNNIGSYEIADEYECARRFGEAQGADNLVAHVIDGRPVTPPSPPATPVQLEARVERISPGPYTAGDKVSVVGAVRDDQGVPRRLKGGTFRVTDASGQATEVRGAVQPDGTVSAEFTLPPTASARIEFIPEVPLGRGEQIRAVASAPQSLQVEVCSFRARVVQPAASEALVSGQSTLLRAALFDAAGQVPVTAPPPGLALEFTVQVEGDAPQRLAADAERSAPWTPPASPRPRAARISAGGRAGERVVCPAGEVSLTVSDLGLGFDTSELPRTCYVGLPCRGVARLQRPAPGPGRQQVDALLADPRVVARMMDTGEERGRGPPRADDRYEFSATYEKPGAASWSLAFQTPRGPVTLPAHEVRVRPALRLELPEVLDFGTVAAGTPVTRVCQRLDFSRSQAAEEHRWELRAEGLTGCQARPVLYFRNALGREDTRALVPSLGIDALDPRDRRLDLCLEVPRCAGEVSPDSAVLRVVPLTPEFSAQARAVRLRWKVEDRGFLGCHGLWVWPGLAVLGLGLLVAGFTRPARFPPGASLRVAGSERGMRQAAAILLRDCPGSRPGFFRDARLGLHGDGEVNGRTRNAPIVLRAHRGAGVVLEGPGPLERQDRRTLRWEPVEDLARGHIPSSSALYRAGGTLFKVEL
jgi:hypothetical protein